MVSLLAWILEGGSVIHSQVPSRLTRGYKFVAFGSRFQIRISAGSDVVSHLVFRVLQTGTIGNHWSPTSLVTSPHLVR